MQDRFMVAAMHPVQISTPEIHLTLVFDDGLLSWITDLAKNCFPFSRNLFKFTDNIFKQETDNCEAFFCIILQLPIKFNDKDKSSAVL